MGALITSSAHHSSRVRDIAPERTGDIRSSLHPPFLPAFVAAHQLVLNSSDPAVVGQGLRVSIALFSIAYAITIYLLLSVYVPRAYASAAAVIAVFQPQYIYFSDSLYAETFSACLPLSFSSFRGTARTPSIFFCLGYVRSSPTRRARRVLCSQRGSRTICCGEISGAC